jgi:hypothetical protein
VYCCLLYDYTDRSCDSLVSEAHESSLYKHLLMLMRVTRRFRRDNSGQPVSEDGIGPLDYTNQRSKSICTFLASDGDSFQVV